MIRNFLVEGKSQIIRLGLKGNGLANASLRLVGEMIQVSLNLIKYCGIYGVL